MNIEKFCPSLCLLGEFPYIFVYCFSCRYLVELGLRQLGVPVAENFLIAGGVASCDVECTVAR